MIPSETELLSPPLADLDAGPGQRLRRTREEASLSIEEVAARLHLDTRTISNLEADNYDALPAPTFVRGYLRSYARLLNIAAEPIIDGFDRRGLEPPALIADISTSEEARSSDTPMRIATFAIAAVLLAGVGIWWQSQFEGNWLSGGNPTTGTTREGPSPAEPLAGTGEGRALPTLRPTDTLPSAELVAAENGATSIPLPAPSVEGQAPPLAAGTGAGDTTTQLPLPGVDTGSAATATTPAAVATPGVGHLVLRVRRSSWIEVYDRSGERLYYGTGRPGESLDLRGAEPISLLLGFAQGVRVEYNGDVVDTETFTARGLARMTLGGG